MKIENLADWVNTVTISEDAKYLIYTLNNGKVQIIPISQQILASGLCDKIGRSLTETEWAEYIGKEVEFNPVCNE